MVPARHAGHRRYRHGFPRGYRLLTLRRARGSAQRAYARSRFPQSSRRLVQGSETSSRHNSPTGLHLRWVDGRLCHQIRQHQRPHSRLNGGSLSCSIGEVGCKKAISPSMTLPDDHSPETSPSSPCFVGTLAAALIHLHTFHQEPARSRNPREERGLDQGLQHPR